MPIGVTKKDIWQAAKTLSQEQGIPTIMSIRSKLGGGSPHMIAAHFSDWKAENMNEESLFYTDWEAHQSKRQELEREQIELMEEIDKLDADLQRAREEVIDNTQALNMEREIHKNMKSHGERWQQQLKEARDTVDNLSAENRALQMEIAALKEQAARSEELRVQIEKLQGDLSGSAEQKGTTKSSAEQKNTSRSRNTKENARKVIPAKNPEIKEPEAKETQKIFPPSFGVAQKITQSKPR